MLTLIITLGIILDMIEYLRTDSKNITTDQDLALWLENNYIRPFVVIGRSDGLIVRDAMETITLIRAHGRYSKVFPMPEGSKLPLQRLWVPGLEPVDVPDMSEDLMSTIEGFAPREPLDRYEMYKTYEVSGGKTLGTFRDELGWTREIREAPKPKVNLARQNRPAAKKASAAKGVPKKCAPEVLSFSNRTARRRKLNEGSNLTVGQKKFLLTFTSATLNGQAGSLSSPLDTPATLVDTEDLTVPLQLRWASPVVDHEQQPMFKRPKKHLGIIDNRIGDELKFRKEATLSSNSDGASTDNDATISVNSINSDEEPPIKVVSHSSAEGEDTSKDESEDDNEALPSSSLVGSSILVPSSPPTYPIFHVPDYESTVDEAVSESSVESEHEFDYNTRYAGSGRVAANNESGSVGGESGEGEENGDTGSTSEGGSIVSASDNDDAGSEYNDVMDLSE